MEQADFLVSIVVITYNSSKYVLETLESAKAQTYQNIELIVSDDCSKDDTVDLCKVWMEANKGRFVRTELITAEKNTGIPANCNRGCKVAKGEWIKLIAGDDILVEHCIEDNKNEIKSVNNNTYVLFSSMLRFDSNRIIDVCSAPSFFSLVNPKDKKYYLDRRYIGLSPSMFIKKNIYSKIGYYNVNYPFLEDYPFIHTLIYHNFDVYYFDKVTVKYRVGDGIYSNNKCIVNSSFYDSTYRFYKDVRRPNIVGFFNKLHYDLPFFKQYIGMKCFNNKYSRLYYIFTKIVDIVDDFFLQGKKNDKFI